MKKLLSAVEVDDLSDDVKVLACADPLRNIVTSEVKVAVVTVCKLEAWAVRGCGAVVAGVDKKVEACFVGVVGSHAGDISVELDGASLVIRYELFDAGVIRLWAFDEGPELLVILNRDVLIAHRRRRRGFGGG